jgi:carbon-monoxide dehydrogenase medium subunit
MKPAAFDYVAPATLEEAIGLLSRHGADAKLLAGGQSFVPMANFRVLRPQVVIDLNRIESLAYISERESGLAIGAMTRHRAIERSSLVRKRCPLMAEAVPNIAHAAIRNRGTLGGSLSHADPAAEWPVVAVALGATLVARSARGERTIPAAEFFVALLSTALEPDEVLVEIRFPGAPARTGAAFLEVSRRHGDFALVSVGAQATLSAAGTLEAVHLALGGVGTSPFDAAGLAGGLVGTRPDAQALAELGRSIAAALEPSEDLHASAQYRRDVAAVLVPRALQMALERAKGSG